MNRSIAVVILNYNTRHHLEAFLPSVLQFSKGAEIIVADNGSPDDSVAWLKNCFPEVRLIELMENKGFCAGYNEALRQVNADYYILLNSDVAVTEGWIDPLVGYLEAHTKAAACQPKIRSYHQPTHFEYAGASGGFLDKLGYPYCRGRLFEHLETDLGQYDDEKKIFWASGACLCIRAQLFHQIGGFDEDFFAHMEEIDLCWRLQHEGWEIGVVPRSIIFHVGGGTLQMNSPRKVFFNYRNGLFLLLKNLPGPYLLPIIFCRLVLDGISGLRMLLLRDQGFPFLWSVVQAHFAFYQKLIIIYKKRKTTKKVIPWGVFSVVWSFFFLKVKKFSSLEKH